MPRRTPPQDRPIIDVAAVEVTRGARPKPPTPAPARPGGALQVFQAQRELLAAQHRAMQEQLARQPTVAVAGVVDCSDLLARSMEALDRAISSVMTSLHQTLETSRPEQDPDNV